MARINYFPPAVFDSPFYGFDVAGFDGGKLSITQEIALRDTARAHKAWGLGGAVSGAWGIADATPWWNRYDDTSSAWKRGEKT